MCERIVIMGVAGCGKSSLAQSLAQALGWSLVEGDDFHSEHNREKMARGVALTDADRSGWLTALGAEMARHPAGVVVTCSALKRDYRNRLRMAAPAVGFVYLHIAQAEAQRRVLARAASHFFNASLVENQFATLESPVGEPGVVTLDASLALAILQARVLDWLAMADRKLKVE